MKTVIVFGVFDLLHKGHEWFLEEASKLGDRLVVIVARDTNVERNKGLYPDWNEEKRREAVEELEFVHEARLGYEEWEKRLQVLDDVKPDIIVFGYDQEPRVPDGNWEVVQLGSYKPEIYKSSLIRAKARKKG